MKVAVLGSGGMGCTVIEHLKKCHLVKKIIAYDIQPERLETVKKRYGIPVSGDLTQLLDDPNLQLVFITASNDAHKHLAISALEAGKAVMCEKPMATNLADAEAMVIAAERTKGFLQIGFELRYSKLYTKIKEWIDSDLLGQVINTQCTYISSARWKGSWRNIKAQGGSMFGEKLSHYVDLPRWWISSSVKDVYSVCAPNTVPYSEVHDNYHTLYRFDNGAVSELTFMMSPAATFRGDPLQCVTDQQKGDGHTLRYTIVGTKGAAATDVFERSIKRWEFGDSSECMTSDWVENLTWTPDEDHFYYHNTEAQCHDIVRRVVEGLVPQTSARDAYETMKLCFAAEESADCGQRVSLN